MSTPANSFDTLLFLGEQDLPRRYQNGKLMVRKDVSRPYWFIQITLLKLDRETGERKPWRRQVRLGFLDEMGKKEAMKVRAHELDKVNAHRSVAHSHLLFPELTAKFIHNRVPNLGVAAQKRYVGQITKHIDPYFKTDRVCDITRVKVEEFLQSKSDALSWWSRVDLKGILSAIFTAAKDWGAFEGDNPTKGVRIGRKKYAREKRLLAVDDLRRLLAALEPREGFIVQIGFFLGLRISEILGLKWQDIDFAEKTLTVCRRWYRGDANEETKSEASAATIRLAAPMVAEFAKRYPGPHKRAQYVFLGDDGHVPPDDRDILRQEFRPVLKRLGLYYPGFGWHALRRAHITYRQSLGGATPLEAQRAARHASLDMTLLYTLSDVERETMQQQRMWDALLGGPAGPKQ